MHPGRFPDRLITRDCPPFLYCRCPQNLCYPFPAEYRSDRNRTMSASKMNPVGPAAHPLPSTVVKDDEPVLVAAAKAGDISAFETLVGRYERKIFRLAKNITQNREDAVDA